MRKWIVPAGVILVVCVAIAWAMWPAANDLLQNAGFESGDSDFSSDYQNDPDAGNPGTFAIGANPGTYNSNWASGIVPHSGNAMLIANGADQPHASIWAQGPLTVRPNTDYYFTGYVASLYQASPPVLVLAINGSQLGMALPLGPTAGQWIKFTVPWNSGNSTTATLSISDQNTQAFGNDFALDDLGFATSPLSVAQQAPAAGAGVFAALWSWNPGTGAGLAILGIGFCVLGVGLIILGVAVFRLAEARRSPGPER
jgi:hypothetical protein